MLRQMKQEIYANHMAIKMLVLNISDNRAIPVVNFATVLRMASGEYFMVGRCRWIDPSCQTLCFIIDSDSNLALVSGTPILSMKKDRR
jgi:predicted DNA-binding ribbon-helix-helix protein